MKHMLAWTFLTALGVGLLLVPARGGDKGLDSPYYPLKKGTAWEYVADGKKITVTVTDHEKVGDLMCAKVETDLGGGNKMIEHLTVKDDGIYRVRANNEDIKPPLLVLKLPPKKGDEWTVDSALKGYGIKGKLSVAAEEKITVGKTEYTAFQVKSSDLKMGGQNATMETWFAKDVGMVKQHFKLPGSGLERTIELEKFTAGK